MPSFQDYLKALTNSVYIQKIRIVLLRQDESYWDEITSIISSSSGSINCKRNNGVRRHCNFDLINLDNKYIPNPDSLWLYQKIRVELALEMPDGNDFWISQGIFIISDPAVVSNFSESLIKVDASDKFCLLDGSQGGELSDCYSIPSGSDVSAEIKKILILANDPQEPLIDPSLVGVTTSYNMTYESGDTLGKIIVDLVQLCSGSVYYDTHGRLVIEKDHGDETKSSQWDYSTDNPTYLGATNQYLWSEVFNSCKVTSSNVNGSNVSYKTQNLNLLSPVSIPNLNGFERVFNYSSNILSTVEQCKNLSEYILKRKSAVQNLVKINSIPIYHLQVDNILTLTDPSLGLVKERLLLNDFSIPLEFGGVMYLNAVKTKEIAFE